MHRVIFETALLIAPGGTITYHILDNLDNLVGDNGCTGIDPSYVQTYSWANPPFMTVPAGGNFTRDLKYSLAFDGTEVAGAYTDTVPVTAVW